MKAAMRACFGMRGEEGAEKAHAGAAATKAEGQRHAELHRPRTIVTIGPLRRHTAAEREEARDAAKKQGEAQRCAAVTDGTV